MPCSATTIRFRWFPGSKRWAFACCSMNAKQSFARTNGSILRESTMHISSEWTTSKKPLSRYPAVSSRSCCLTTEAHRQAAHANFDLMLSGHTHGGQICLPGSIPIKLEAVLPRRMGAGPWQYRDMTGYTSVGGLERRSRAPQLSAGNYLASFTPRLTLYVCSPEAPLRNLNDCIALGWSNFRPEARTFTG